MLLDVIRTSRKMTDSVIVSFSGGKDSIVTLDLCCQHFQKVFVFFMYFVKGLEMQECVLRWYENKYNIEIYRIPHFELSGMFKYGLFRLPDDQVDIVKINDVYNHVREKSGYEWIAAGERIDDSIWRRAMIKNSGTIVPSRRRIFPIAYWDKSHVITYIKRHKLKLPPEYKYFTSSFGGPGGDTMQIFKDRWINDYNKMKSWFPFVDAAAKRMEFFGDIIHGRTKDQQTPEI